MVVFPDALRTLARDRSNGATAMRVLFWAWENLGYERHEMLRQEDVALDLNMSAAAVRKGLSRLLAEGILERAGKGQRQQWRLTPKASWRGGAERYQEVVAGRGSAASEAGKALRALPRRKGA